MIFAWWCLFLFRCPRYMWSINSRLPHNCVSLSSEIRAGQFNELTSNRQVKLDYPRRTLLSSESHCSCSLYLPFRDSFTCHGFHSLINANLLDFGIRFCRTFRKARNEFTNIHFSPLLKCSSVCFSLVKIFIVDPNNLRYRPVNFRMDFEVIIADEKDFKNGVRLIRSCEAPFQWQDQTRDVQSEEQKVSLLWIVQEMISSMGM
jgi:hypothetical protein